MTKRKAPEDKLKAGAPTKYRPEYCDMLIDHMRSGLSFLSFAGTVDVHYDTLYEWEKNFPEFSEARKRGVAKLLAYDEKLLLKGAEGKQRGYNIAAHKWKMTNIHKWTDRVETTERRPGDKTDDELLADVKKLIEEVEREKGKEQ